VRGYLLYGRPAYPDKTLTGRVERGFDFLGYFLKPSGLAVSDKTIKRFKKNIAQLYEQDADSACIGQYVLRWLRSGLMFLYKIINLVGRKCYSLSFRPK